MSRNRSFFNNMYLRNLEILSQFGRSIQKYPVYVLSLVTIATLPAIIVAFTLNETIILLYFMLLFQMFWTFFAQKDEDSSHFSPSASHQHRPLYGVATQCRIRQQFSSAVDTRRERCYIRDSSKDPRLCWFWFCKGQRPCRGWYGHRLGR